MEQLKLAEHTGKLPKIVIPVHYAGQSCDMKAIRALADQYGFSIIEDASHAIGGRYLDKPVGNCLYSDITVFSYHPVKIITTAEGGMATTNNNELAKCMGRLRSHGVTRDPDYMVSEMEGPWYYQQIELGFNFRMTDIQAALGYSQIQRLEDYVQRRHQIRNTYDDILKELPVTVPWQHPDSHSAFHLYPVQINEKISGVDRKQVFEALREAGIGVNVHYIPVHTQPYFQHLGFRHEDFPNAVKYYQRTISLPMYPALTENQQSEIAEVIRHVMS